MGRRDSEPLMRPSSDQFNADDFDYDAIIAVVDGTEASFAASDANNATTEGVRGMTSASDMTESFSSTASTTSRSVSSITRVIGDKPHLLIGDTELLGIPRFEKTFTFRVNEAQDSFEAAGEDTLPLPPLK